VMVDLKKLTGRVVNACRKCWEATGHLPEIVLLPEDLYEPWVKEFGPLMKVVLDTGLSRALELLSPQEAFREVARLPAEDDLLQVRTCTLRVRRNIRAGNIVSVVNPLRGGEEA